MRDTDGPSEPDPFAKGYLTASEFAAFIAERTGTEPKPSPDLLAYRQPHTTAGLILSEKLGPNDIWLGEILAVEDEAEAAVLARPTSPEPTEPTEPWTDETDPTGLRRLLWATDADAVVVTAKNRAGTGGGSTSVDRSVLEGLLDGALLARPATATDVSASRPTRDPVDVDYAELERLARAATPSPWFSQPSEHEPPLGVVYGPDGDSFASIAWNPGNDYDPVATAEYIAAASPDVVLRLLARRAPVDREREAREILEALWLLTDETETVPLVDLMPGELVDRINRFLGIGEGALAADSRPEQPAPLDVDLEGRYRRLLWLTHGHGQSLYGDDGELQCQACMPVWDYRRMPLAEVEEAAATALFLMNRAAAVRPEEPPE